MAWAQIILLILQEAPQVGAIIQKWLSVGNTPTVEDLQAELTVLGVDDTAMASAYAKLFPGKTIPQ